jgi:hypothetical protein
MQYVLQQFLDFRRLGMTPEKDLRTGMFAVPQDGIKTI